MRGSQEVFLEICRRALSNAIVVLLLNYLEVLITLKRLWHAFEIPNKLTNDMFRNDITSLIFLISQFNIKYLLYVYPHEYILEEGHIEVCLARR